MGIDNIKPAGGYRPADGSADPPAGTKGPGTFSDTRAKLETPANNPSSPSLNVIAQFQRTELEDPAKLDAMVRSSASELVSSQATSVPLSRNDQQKLVEFLCEDPAFRQRVEAYLRKALS
jgi:hypothetical protein